MDLSALRLTAEDHWERWNDSEGRPLSIADAQLTKALWGIAEWLASLEHSYSQGASWTMVHREFLRNRLLAVGIPKEGGRSTID